MSKIRVYAALGVLLALAASTSPPCRSSDRPGLEFFVGAADPLYVTQADPTFEVTLRLINRTNSPIYVSPVIGQINGSTRIYARQAGRAGRPELIYAHDIRSNCHDLNDLFKLMPGRTLEMSLRVDYPTQFPQTDNQIEIWGEYDFREMKRVDPRAAAEKLVSEPTLANVTFLR
jgi:hypothetical protein